MSEEEAKEILLNLSVDKYIDERKLDIKDIEAIITLLDLYNKEKEKNKELEEKLNDLVQVKQDVGSITYTMPSKLAKASMELLINSDLKMINKKLQEKIKEQQKQLNIANKKILAQKGQLKVVNTSYIPKSKVKEKIEEYEKDYDRQDKECLYNMTKITAGKISSLQELLQ